MKALNRWNTFWNREGLLGPVRRRLVVAMLILAVVMGCWHGWHRIELAAQTDQIARKQLQAAAQAQGQNIDDWPDSVYEMQFADMRSDVKQSVIEPERKQSLRSMFVALFLTLVSGGLIYADQRVARSIARERVSQNNEMAP